MHTSTVPLPLSCRSLLAPESRTRAGVHPRATMDVELPSPPPSRAAPESDEQLLAKCPVRKRKKPTFDAAAPSNYCHVCSRTASRSSGPNRMTIRMVPCAALREGSCRKVVCDRCFDEYSLGPSFEEASRPGATWLCVHCQGACPERAQCRTYKTVNRRLKLHRLRQAAKTRVVAKPEPKVQAEKAAPRTRPTAQRRSVVKDSQPHPTNPCQSESPKLQQAPHPASPCQSESPKPGQAHDRSMDSEPVCEEVHLPSAISQQSPAQTLQRYGVYRATFSTAAADEASETENESFALSEIASLTCQLCEAERTVLSESFRKCAGTLDPACINTFCSSCMQTRPMQWSAQVAEMKGERWNCFHCTGTFPPPFGERKGYAPGMEVDDHPKKV